MTDESELHEVLDGPALLELQKQLGQEWLSTVTEWPGGFPVPALFDFVFELLSKEVAEQDIEQQLKAAGKYSRALKFILKHGYFQLGQISPADQAQAGSILLHVVFTAIEATMVKSVIRDCLSAAMICRLRDGVHEIEPAVGRHEDLLVRAVVSTADQFQENVESIELVEKTKRDVQHLDDIAWNFIEETYGGFQTPLPPDIRKWQTGRTVTDEPDSFRWMKDPELNLTEHYTLGEFDSVVQLIRAHNFLIRKIQHSVTVITNSTELRNGILCQLEVAPEKVIRILDDLIFRPGEEWDDSHLLVEVDGRLFVEPPLLLTTDSSLMYSLCSQRNYPLAFNSAQAKITKKFSTDLLELFTDRFPGCESLSNRDVKVNGQRIGDIDTAIYDPKSRHLLVCEDKVPFSGTASTVLAGRSQIKRIRKFFEQDPEAFMKLFGKKLEPPLRADFMVVSSEGLVRSLRDEDGIMYSSYTALKRAPRVENISSMIDGFDRTAEHIVETKRLDRSDITIGNLKFRIPIMGK